MNHARVKSRRKKGRSNAIFDTRTVVYESIKMPPVHDDECDTVSYDIEEELSDAAGVDVDQEKATPSLSNDQAVLVAT